MPRTKEPPNRLHLDKRVAAILHGAAELPDDLLIDKRQLCALQGVSKAFVDARIADGSGPTVTRLGARVRFKMSDLREWWQSRADAMPRQHKPLPPSTGIRRRRYIEASATR